MKTLNMLLLLVFFPLNSLAENSAIGSDRGLREFPSAIMRIPPDGVIIIREPRGTLGPMTAHAASGLIRPSYSLPSYWSTDIREGYSRALSEGKVLVVYAKAKLCSWCSKQDEVLSSSSKVRAFEDCAVFVAADESQDKTFLQLITALQIENFPALSIILPETDRVTETDRLEGFTEEGEFVSYLKNGLLRAAIQPGAPAALRANPIAACPALATIR